MQPMQAWHEAIERYGAKRLLADLLNVQNDISARAFLQKCGCPLHPQRPAEQDVIEAADVFRKVFSAETHDEVATAERFLETIFILPVEGPFDRPAVRVNFLSGTWEPTPRTLVDALAIELVRSRKMLHRCERPECNRYFVKEFSRDRYCSMLCSQERRRRGQSEWAQKHRAELNKRRRKSQGKQRRTK